MKIRNLEKNEYKSVTDIHLKAFDNFFLTSLGRRFLNTYYKACLKSKERISIGFFDDDNIIRGYGIGTIHSLGFHKRLLIRNFPFFCVEALIFLFTKFMVLIRLFKNFNKISNPNDDGNYAELLSIAVLPSHKGKGMGKLLLKQFEEEAKNLGCKKIALTTDYFHNDDVISFYLNFGYKIFYKFTAFPNREMYKLIKDL